MAALNEILQYPGSPVNRFKRRADGEDGSAPHRKRPELARLEFLLQLELPAQLNVEENLNEEDYSDANSIISHNESEITLSSGEEDGDEIELSSGEEDGDEIELSSDEEDGDEDELSSGEEDGDEEMIPYGEEYGDEESRAIDVPVMESRAIENSGDKKVKIASDVPVMESREIENSGDKKVKIASDVPGMESREIKNSGIEYGPVLPPDYDQQVRVDHSTYQYSSNPEHSQGPVHFNNSTSDNQYRGQNNKEYWRQLQKHIERIERPEPVKYKKEPVDEICVLTFYANKFRIGFSNKAMTLVEYSAIQNQLWRQTAYETLTVRVACQIGLQRLQQTLYDEDRSSFFRNVKSLTLTGVYNHSTLCRFMRLLRGMNGKITHFCLDNFTLDHYIPHCKCMRYFLETLPPSITSLGLDLRSTHYRGFQPILCYLVRSGIRLEELNLFVASDCNIRDFEESLVRATHIARGGSATILIEEPFAQNERRYSRWNFEPGSTTRHAPLSETTHCLYNAYTSGNLTFLLHTQTKRQRIYSARESTMPVNLQCR